MTMGDRSRTVFSLSTWPCIPLPRVASSILPDVCFIHPLPVLQGESFSWERHAPAWLLQPGWSPALPGKGTDAGHTKYTSKSQGRPDGTASAWAQDGRRF